MAIAAVGDEGAEDVDEGCMKGKGGLGRLNLFANALRPRGAAKCIKTDRGKQGEGLRR